MSVDVSHLVLVALGDANNHVVDDGTDSTERGDGLARSMVQLDVDEIFPRVVEVHGQMTQVLDQFSSRTLDGHIARLDGNLDCRDSR